MAELAQRRGCSPWGLKPARGHIDRDGAGNPDIGIADLERAVAVAGERIVGFRLGSRLGDAIITVHAGQGAFLCLGGIVRGKSPAGRRGGDRNGCHQSVQAVAHGMTIVPRSLRNQTSGGEMDATPSAFNVVIRLQGLQISILV